MSSDSNSKPGARALAAANAPATATATAAKVKEAANKATTVNISTKHQPAVQVTPISVPPSNAPSASAATNPPSSPPRSGRPDPASAGSNHDDNASRLDGSLNSQNLAWDQAVLRIEYLVSTMTTPSPYSPILSPLDNISPINQNLQNPLSPPMGAGYALSPTSPPATPTDHLKDDEGRGVRMDAEGAEAGEIPPATKGWPSVPRDKVRRKVLQIDTWRAEIEAYGAGAFCACSSPAPMIPASDNSSKQPGSPLDPTTPTSPVDVPPPSARDVTSNAIVPPIHIPPAAITCGFCGRPPTPFVALKSPTVAAGVKKAFVNGFKGLLRRRSGSRKGRDKEGEKGKIMESGAADKDQAGAPRAGESGRHPTAGERENDEATFTQTAMYHIDLPPARPSPKPGSQSHQDRQSPDVAGRAAVGQDSNDGDDEEVVDLDNLSQSTNPRGLLQTNDRLKRAEKLLAESRGGGAKAAEGALQGTKSLPIGDGGGGGGGGSGFGLGWGKNNGDRSRKGFGKLL